MPPPRAITSLDNPRVKQVVSLLRHRQRDKQGLFVAEGVRQITRALAAGLPLVELYECPDLLASAAVGGVFDAIPSSQRLHVTEPVMQKMAYRAEHAEGVLAVFKQPSWSLDDLELPKSPLILVAVGLTKPGNLGAIARSLEAAGGHALFVADAQVDPFNPNALHASTGAVFTLPVVCESSARLMAFLVSRSIPIHPAVPPPAPAKPVHEVDLTGPIALVIGTEHAGLTAPWWIGKPPTGNTSGGGVTSGGAIFIPMAGKIVDSLNASVAAGILLFEARRQRLAASH
ncbi:MAG: RNA methyltransferase [Phycisphaeraceae bacterium]|nr:RNA methyltransferase [Phycisphaeraceae bacterium]